MRDLDDLIWWGCDEFLCGVVNNCLFFLGKVKFGIGDVKILFFFVFVILLIVISCLFGLNYW